MKLIKVQVKNFRSIEDSNDFDVGDLTCLVGKNEAGKTAILQALYALNPFGNFIYDKIRDYPRRFLSRFIEKHPEGKSKVVETTWKLFPQDKRTIVERFGENALTSDEIKVISGIGFSQTWSIQVDHEACLESLLNKHALDAIERDALNGVKSAEEAIKTLELLPQRSEKLAALLADLKKCSGNSFILAILELLSSQMPKFFYTSHFDRMSGEIALNKLLQDKQKKQVSISDQIFLDFLEYAGTSLEELQQTTRFEELVAQCEGASNDITDEIFQFWSQNEALRVNIQLGEGKAEDPPPFNSGTIAKIRIENINHRASVPLSERSAGFVWFFSFLSQFKQLKKTTGNAIILLDEPGLTLHGKAQADLLRYIEERLLPQHQVIYSTHSPFMIPSERLADVRVVEDVIKRGEKNQITVLGTKVSSDILSVDKDTLFPLQGALGYEITQSLFIGKNTLLVEGPSDILYLQAFSEALKRLGRTGLSPQWAVCPSGGIDKIMPFASLFGGNKLNVAVLSDIAMGDKSKIERLRKSQILESEQLFTVADFTGKPESDIEDLIHPSLYVEILNNTYALDRSVALDVAKLDSVAPMIVRLVKKAEAAFKLMPPESPELDHFQPANWLIRHPMFLDNNSEALEATLNLFERVFITFNNLLSKAP